MEYEIKDGDRIQTWRLNLVSARKNLNSRGDRLSLAMSKSSLVAKKSPRGGDV